MYQEWQGKTIESLLDYSSFAWPDHVAIRMDGHDTTYAELAAGVRATGDALRRLGVSRGDRVATLIGLGPRWAEVLFALLDIGAVVVPLNLTWTEREIVQGLSITDAQHLVVESHHRGGDLFALVARSLPSVVDAHAGAVRIDELPELRSVLGLRSEGFDGDLPGFVADVDRAGGAVDAVATEGVATAPSDPALMLLTSGTTSFPKAAVISHRAVLCGLAHVADGLEIDERSVFVNCAPSYHVAGFLTLGAPLLRGACMVGMRWFDPAEAMRLIAENRATHFWGFDTHFAMMRDCPEFGSWDLSSVQHTLAASNPSAAPKIVDMGFSHHGSAYGSTEYMGTQAFFPRRDARDRQRMLASHGRANSGELRISAPGAGEVLEPGEIGEICVRGPALFTEYYKRPEETAACIDADGFFHSGDRGYLDAEGYLYYLGRYKEMIKSGGENVSIFELEQFLTSSVSGVRRAAVMATPHETWGEAVTVVVVAEPGSGLTSDQLVAACRGQLAPYKIPKRILFVGEDRWSVTPTGKVDRAAMRELAMKAISDGDVT